uniref:RING-type E3 ubiquitin transferase BRCA1 n=1 Tax=Leersia perrieri TaxID=77586 RepID=A0A0D9W739_9ORYZ
MESFRRFMNPLVLNLQKMELELTCPVCLKLLNAPTMLPYLRPASHLEAIVNIHRSLSSTVKTMVTQQEVQAGIPVAKTSFQGTPESGNRNGAEKSDQMKSYTPVASKLAYNQSTGLAYRNVDGAKERNPALETRGADATAMPPILVRKGPCGSQSSDDPRDLDYDSNGLEGELITSRSSPQSVLKREPNAANDDNRELKRQKSTDQDDRQPAIGGVWECEFCHSSKTTESTGPLSHYLHGEPLEDSEVWKSNVLHVHEKCIEWAPQAFFTGDIVNNLEPELARASKIKCSVCGLKGAALGCLVKSCRKSFHVPCAHGISGCRWDEENFVMLCPSHSSKKLPCERSKSRNKKARLQRSSSDTMLDDLNSPSPIQMNELWTASPFLTSEWVICGSALSCQEKDILDQFEHHTGITVINSWRSNVTHVIANTDERGACARTLKVLMAILAGKWVVNINWLKACMEAKEPVPEEPYEISCDVHGSFDGPRMGRLRAMQNAPHLFTGLTFYLCGHFMPNYKVHLEDLITAAGGSILDKADIASTSLIIYSMEPPQGSDPDTLNEVIRRRKAEAEELAATIGCRAVPHTCVLDSIASCTVQMTI